MSIQITRVEPDGIICLHTTGPLEGAGIGPVPDRRISDLLGEEWATERILLDLTATDYVDSSVIGWLLATQRKLRQAGGALALCGLSANVKDVFNLMKIDKILAAYEHSTEAVASLRQPN